MNIKNALCDFAVNPINVGIKPRFTWQIETEKDSTMQSEYRLVVSSSVEKIQNGDYDLFDSGVVKSADTACIYDGLPLNSCQGCFWMVKIFAGEWTEFCEPQYFETALLDEALWEGRFIGIPHGINAAGMFRKRFNTTKKILKARAYLAAEGYAELYLNGRKQGDAVLDPVNTDYSKRLMYVCYDITDSLLEGDNAFGVLLSTGWASNNSAKFMLQAFIWYEDGTKDSIYTMPMDWLFILSPWASATIYSGEVYNGLYERPEWYLPTDDFEKKYKLGKWRLHSAYQPKDRNENPDHFDTYFNACYYAAELVAPGGTLEPQRIEPIKVMEEINPVRFLTDPKGNIVVDFGQNFAGWVKIKLRGQKGEAITLRFTELLNDDNSLNMDYLIIADPTYQLPMQTDVIFLKGEEEEVYMQKFTYHGFRYVGIEGNLKNLSLDDITGCFVYSSVKQSGFFECSNQLINQIQKCILYTEKSNLYGIPTDCPQRAERQGWLNDLNARVEESIYNFDLARFYIKFLKDIVDTQDLFSGAVSDTAPNRRANRPGDPVSCFTLLPALINQFYGDDRPIREHYDRMKRWTDFLYRNSVNGIVPVSFWGDWASPMDGCSEFGLWSAVSAITPGDFVSSGFLYFNVCHMLDFSKMLKKDGDTDYYSKLKETLKDSLNREYYDAETYNFAGGSQGSNAFALYLDIVPKADIAKVAKNIADDVIKRDYHLTTGNLFTKYLPEMLTEHGYVDIAFKIATQTTYPSWGYMIENGATTIWERWELATGYGMNSHSHPMYGSISAWYYKYLAGISPAEPGFRKARIKPYFPAQLDSAGAVYKSVNGDIVSRWTKVPGEIIMDVTLPAGTSAEIYIPITDVVSVNGKILSKDCKIINDRICFEALSGQYIIKSTEEIHSRF